MKRLRITVNGMVYEVEVEVLSDDDEAVVAAPTSFAAPPPARSAVPPAVSSSTTTPNTHQSGPGVLVSPIAGIVAEIKVNVGDQVKENDPLVVIEAMKMNSNVSSPVAGTIRAINVKVGDSVRQGQPLLEFA
ncbi:MULTISPECIES: biotin/lipoyl-containing protein [Chloroflexus]|uniref:Biotin/lipoyl attachment domain-containing protein n=1 Tax=Chloroflexus aggregans (strain MD-66 / DSM 9485) TaxID=326427 RepID=B8G6H8_CHLAD|nr:MULTISPECIES: biotin/lipoyl-containing protein [Chloroflexus]ACL23915.1 biotin/lipoyl attachment domain-containing protein [Chloroflexus aggregans DSM 9485]GIV90189.1 MAG: acetyl-CoA carboxylase biotin carboxyl carrier protein subunit [Chloroflexus sp.]